jgi:hypothetical protein
VEWLHQPVELGPKAALAKVRAGVDEVSLPLTPFRPPVLEPNLELKCHFSSSYNMCPYGKQTVFLSFFLIYFKKEGDLIYLCTDR